MHSAWATKEQEDTVQLYNYHATAILVTWRDDSHNWSAAITESQNVRGWKEALRVI